MTRWLSVHVPYACRHRGACCGADWPLPVEAGPAAAIGHAVATRHVETVDGQSHWLLRDPESPPGMAGRLRVLPGGRCVFHHQHGKAGGSCAVHTALGHDALPRSCRHFPRVCLIDARGVHVTLSHYCPTAAGLLVDHQGPVTIVEGPDAVPGLDVPEGLDARDVLPPALTPRVLMDVDGYTAWERHMVETLAGLHPRGHSAEDALALLAGDARALAGWRPGGTALAEAVSALGRAGERVRGDRPSDLALFEQARASCHESWTWPEAPADLARVDARLVAPGWATFDAVLRRYLASHAFAAWGPYQGATLASVVTGVARALAVVRIEAVRMAVASAQGLDRPRMVEAIRRADLLLRHYADPARLT